MPSPTHRWLEYRNLALFLGMMFVFRSAWADWMVVPTGSMNPTIVEGDRVLVDKHVFGLRVPFTRTRLTDGEDPVRGDIVVFDSPADGKTLIKRVAAVPGDTIALDHERLIVNGVPARYAAADARLVDKHAFGLRVPFTRTRLTDGEDPARGDIVVFDSPADGKTLIKRVAAVPGDTIALDHERLIVNGVLARYAAADARLVDGLPARTRALEPLALTESGLAATHRILLIPGRGAAATMAPVTVPDGSYFMLGDNRDNSADSRYIGFVPRERIVGRARRVLVSLDPDAYYLPRAARTLTMLD